MRKSVQPKETGDAFRLGNSTVYPHRNEIESNGECRRLEPLAMKVLLVIVRSRNDVVPRETIISQVWGGSFSNDEGLTQAISKIRKVLGDTAVQGRYIRTVPKVGYRLTAVIEPVRTERPRHRFGAEANPRTHQYGMYLLAALFVALLLNAVMLNQAKRESLRYVDPSVPGDLRLPHSFHSSISDDRPLAEIVINRLVDSERTITISKSR